VSAIRLTDAERLDWLRLIRSDRVGPRTFRALVARFGTAAEALSALPGLARRAGRGRLELYSRADAEREMEAARALGARFVAIGEAEYPLPLGATDGAPPLIAIRGEAGVLARPTVAIVGSRNASATGGAFAERLARGLGEAGFVVASGLARGIDTRAHRAALASGTVAVLAGGHDRLYPRENMRLLEQMVAEGGAALTEMPFGWEPRGRDFPRRNRIVSGMSYGVVVVEAARRSGSLITARFAAEQGREVFAVPGSPLDPRAEGTNDLIRTGATLCASVDHVVSALTPLLANPPAEPSGLWKEAEGGGYGQREEPLWDELDFASDMSAPSARIADEPAEAEEASDRSRIEDLLGASPVDVDELSRQSGLPIRAVQSVLVELELSGQLMRHGGNLVSLLP
jgi:DNA processing protein